MKTKIIYAALLVVMVFSATAFSQVKLGIGVEGGLNIANISSTPEANLSSRTGMIIGANLNVGFGKFFVVQPGLRFVMKGASSSDATGTAVAKLNYFEIPVLLKVEFPMTEVKPYIIAGPIMAINMSANVDQTPTGGTTTTTDISTNISGMDFNLLAGGGVGFMINHKVELFAQFGYSFGLSNLLKNATTSTWKTTGVQITAGAIFGL